MEFKNRQGSHPNRKILNIISQTPTQIVVDVERDNTGVTEEGTPINAEVFNTFQAEITTAVSTANTANTTSQNAKNVADEAKTLAGQANTNSSTAVTTATEAKTLASSANTKSDTAVSTANVAKTESTSALAIATEAKTKAESIEGQIPTKTSQLTNDSNFATTAMLDPKLESTNIIAGSNIELTKNGKNVTITALSGGVGNITMNGSTTTSPKFYAPTSGGGSGYRDIYYENELPAIGSTVSGTSGGYVLVNGNATVDSVYYDDESEYWTYYYTSKTPIWKAVNNSKGYTYQSIYNNSTGTSNGTITWTGGQQYSIMNNIFVIVAKQGTTGYRTFVVNCDAASSSTPYCIYGSSSSYYIKFYFSSARTITISSASGMTITRVMQLYPNELNTL